MVTLIENPTPELLLELQQFCSASCLGVKAIGPLLSYGTSYSFVSAWEQKNEAGERTAFLSKDYGTVVAYLASNASEDDLEELKAFLSVIGYSVLISSPEVTETEPAGFLMKLEQGKDCIAQGTKEPVTFVADEHLKEFYGLLAQNNPGYFAEDFDAWLVDFSHRIRHGTASSLLLQVGTDFCSSAAALSITEPAVFLGAISTNINCRGKHYAYSVLSHLAQQYSHKTVYLMCKPEKQAFYEKAGMHTVGTYAERKGEMYHA